MSENGVTIDPARNSVSSTANLIYILYLVAIVVGLTGLVGVIMAYVNKNDGPEWLRSHYRFQIRTFWIYFLYALVGAVTSLIVIGWFIILFAVVWFIVRSVKGMKYLGEGLPYPNENTWLW